MDLLDKFLHSPWFEKLFWLCFVAVAVFIVVIWIRILFESFRFLRPLTPSKPSGRAKTAAGGIAAGTGVETATYAASPGLTFATSSDISAGTSSDSSDSDSASSDSGGGDFSGGGGDYGGGGSSGGW